MASNDAKRLKRLKELQARLENDKNVSLRDLKQWLNDKQIEDWEFSEEVIKQQDSMWKDRPPEFDPYLEFLKKAQTAYSSAERIAAKNRATGNKTSQGADNLMNAADGYFEQAMESLQEILERNPELRDWLNNDIKEFESDGNEPGIDPTNVPRLKNSKSQHADNDLSGRKRGARRHAKKEVIGNAIKEIENGPTPVDLDRDKKAPKMSVDELKKILKR